MSKVIRIGELPTSSTIDNQDLLVINNFVEDRTYAITWLDLIGNIKEINQPVIFSRGTATRPSLAFVDYNAGFFSPGPGQLAVTTNGTPRMIFDGQGNIELGSGCGIGGITFNSNTLFKCETTFNENLDVFGDVDIKGDVTINGELQFAGNIGIEINGNLFAYGDVTFGDPSNGCAGFFEIYSKSTYYCDAFFEQNLQVDKNITIGDTLTTGNLVVSGDTSLQGQVNLTGNIVVNDNILIDINQGDIVISGDLNVGGVITGDGSGITNLNIPGSLTFRGAIDLTQPAPSGPETGDLYVTDNGGVAHFSFNGIAGESYEANQFVFYTVNNTWDLGSVQNEEGFVTLSGTQTITGEKTFTSVLNALGGINAVGQSIVAKDLTLTGKGISSLTVASDSDVTLTTKSYVDDRSVNAIGDFPLTFGDYISGSPSDQYDGSIAITASINATPSNTPNYVVARDINGDFAARRITADLIGRADVSNKLDVLIDNDSTNISYPLFINPTNPTSGTVSESQLVYADSGLYYDPSTNTLSTDRVVASITGDVTGNADTATRLETPRTLWGQTFDGTANVVGDMVNVGDIVSQLSNVYNIGTVNNVWANVYATTFYGYLEGNAAVAERTKEKLTAGLHILSTNGVTEFDGSVATTWYIDETPENVASKIVSRDLNGSFRSNVITANEFVGPLTGDVTGNVSGSSGSSTGNAATATALETPRLLWGQSFDGTADVTGTLTDVGNIFPQGSSEYNIGTPSEKFANVYVDNIFADIDGNSGSSDKVNSPLTRGNYISGGPISFDGSVAGTWNIDATPLNSSGFIVARDSNGDFAAGTITANFIGPLTGDVIGNVSGSSGSSTGNAPTATALETPRTLWGQTFDGTSNVAGDMTDTGSIVPLTNLTSTVGTASLQYSDIYATTFHGDLDGIADTANRTNHSLFRGAHITGVIQSFNGSIEDTWGVDATPDNVPDRVVSRDSNGNFSAEKITTNLLVGNVIGNVTGNVTGSSGSCTGNAATATKLQTARNIEVQVTGATLGSGTASFDGTSDVEIVVPTEGIVDLQSLTPLPA